MKTIMMTMCAFFGANLFAAEKAIESYKLKFAEKTKEPIVIDGILNESDWKRAEPITDFGPCTISQAAPRNIPRTEVKVLWDDKYLYVSAKCYEDSKENMESFLKIINDQKRVIFTRDCIELHIDGNNDEHTTFQCWMVANKEKAVYWNWDFGWGLLTDGNYGLNADWQQSFQINDDNWVVETRFALSHFEIKPKVGYMFGLEPARFRYNKKIYSPDKEKILSPNGGMWLAWGAQGKNHHNADGYGKIVLVDKAPSSVKEGLSLAYKDLDKRVIYVQTGSEYAVFEKGASRTLPYLDKAKELVNGVDRLRKKLDDFIASSSNDCVKAASNALRVYYKERKDFLAVRDEVEAAKDMTVAKITELTEKTGKWSGKFDTYYWEVVRNLLKIEGKSRVSVKLNPPADAPALNSEEDWSWFRPEKRNSPFVKWAAPLAGKRKKVFITAHSQGAYDAWALAKRIDIDAFIFKTANASTIGVTSDYYNEGLWRTDKKRAELERALKENGPFDAYVFMGCRSETWPMELQCWLWERVAEGAKIIVHNGDGRYTLPMSKCPPQKELSEGIPSGMTACVPDSSTSSGLKEVPVKFVASDLVTAPFGKGTYSDFSTGKKGGYVHTSIATPAWNCAADKLFQDEYCFAWAVKCYMQALGLREDRRALSVCGSYKEIESDKPFTVAFETEGSGDWAGEIGWLVRKSDGTVVCAERTKKVALAAKRGHVSLPVDALATGRYTVDVFLYDAKKNIVDFAAGAIEAKPKASYIACACTKECKETIDTPVISSFKIITPLLENNATKVAASVEVSPATKDLTVVAELRDVRNRVLTRASFPVDPETGKAALSIDQIKCYDWTCFFVDVKLLCAGRRIDSKSESVFRHRGEVNDYQIFTGAPGMGGYMGYQRFAMLQNYGINLYQIYSADRSYLYHGGDIVYRDRIPGGTPDKGGSLSSKWWLKHLTARYAAHARQLRKNNGRWISLGDDSGNPSDFYDNIPDFVPAWVQRQMASIDKRSKVLAARKVDRPVVVACQEWYESFGLKPERVTDRLYNNYWGFECYPKGQWKKILNNAKTPAQLKDYIDSFKETYETIECFNVHANASIKDWEELTLDTIRNLKFERSPEWCNFLLWLKRTYKDISNLNKAWGTEVKSFTDIKRPMIDEQKMEGVLTPSIDMQVFLEKAFVDQARAIAKGIKSVDPTIGLGFGASVLGNTFQESVKYLDTVCPYVGSDDIELMRGQKHHFIGETIGTYGGRQVGRSMRYRQVWHGLLTGCNFSWYWDSCFVSGDLTLNPGRLGWMLEAYREILNGPAALCLRSKRQNDGIRILISPSSGRYNALVNDMNTHPQARSVLMKIVESIGYQYDSITSEQVEKGLLAGSKILVIPYAQSLSQLEAAKIREFVKAGGTIIADARVATFDEKGCRNKTPLLDDVFGIKHSQVKPVCELRDFVVSGIIPSPVKLAGALTDLTISPAATAVAYGKSSDGASAFICNNFGKGRAFYLNFNPAVVPFLDGRNELGGVRDVLKAVFSAAGKAHYVLKKADGSDLTGTEFSRFVRDGVTYLGVEKLGHSYEKFPMEAKFVADKKSFVYDIRKGKFIGEVSEFPMTLSGLDFEFFALMPYKVEAMKLDVPAKVKRGTSLEVCAEIAVSAGKPVTHVFRVEMLPPGGWTHEKLLPFPVRVLDAKAGRLTTSFPIAFNDEPGSVWTLKVTDVATGVGKEVKITIE